MTDSGDGNDTDEPRSHRQSGWVARRVEKIKEQLQKRRADKEKESATDRAARSTARATWAIAFFTVAMAVVGGLQWNTLHDTDQSIKRQLAVMERQYEGAERPWLATSFIPIGDMRFDKEYGLLRIQVTLKNTGHTPAINVSSWAEGYFPSTVEDILAKQDQICRLFSPETSGDTIFPGETVVLERDVDFFPEDLAKGRLPMEGIASDVFRHPTIGVCVNYSFSFGPNERHQTAVALQIYRKSGAWWDRILPRGTIPLSELVVNSHSRLSIGNRAN